MLPVGRHAPPVAKTAAAPGTRGGPGQRAFGFACLGLLAGELPGLLHGATPLAIWALACAAVGGLAGVTLPAARHRSCTGDSWMACMAAVGLGMAVDLAGVSPLALASICRTSSEWPYAGIAMLEAHLRWFPWTAAAMLFTLALDHGRTAPAVARAARGGGLAPLVAWGLVEFGAMLVLMSTFMEAAGALALAARMPWAADGMVASMLASMLLYFHLRLAARRVRQTALRCWKNRSPADGWSQRSSGCPARAAAMPPERPGGRAETQPP